MMCIARRNRGFAKLTKLMPVELARRWMRGAPNAICKKKFVTFVNNILQCKKNAGWSEIPAFPNIAFDGSREYDKHVGGAGYRHGTRTPG